MPDDLLVTVKAKVASDDAMTMMSASETRSLLRALVVRCEQAEADLAAARLENAHLREAFVTMEQAVNQHEREVERLRKALWGWWVRTPCPNSTRWRRSSVPLPPRTRTRPQRSTRFTLSRPRWRLTMSDPPKAHVYQPTTPDGHCADCGRNIVASWHYVKGADYAALRERHAEMAAELTQLREAATMRLKAALEADHE